MQVSSSEAVDHKKGGPRATRHRLVAGPSLSVKDSAPERPRQSGFCSKYCARVRRMLTGTRAAGVTRASRYLVNIIKLLNESPRADGNIGTTGPMRRKWRAKKRTKPDWQAVMPMPCSNWPRNRAGGRRLRRDFAALKSVIAASPDFARLVQIPAFQQRRPGPRLEAGAGKDGRGRPHHEIPAHPGRQAPPVRAGSMSSPPMTGWWRASRAKSRPKSPRPVPSVPTAKPRNSNPF